MDFNEPVTVNVEEQTAVEAHAKGSGVIAHSATWMGVYGHTDSVSGGAGVMGEGGEAGGPGVIGKSATWHGVYGETSAKGETGAAAVWGENKKNGSGVAGVSALGVGVYGRCPSVDGHAGYFAGRVYVQGGRLECENTIVGKGGDAGLLAADFKGDVKATGQFRPNGTDYAEEFDAEEGADPGTVLVIGDNGLLAPCSGEYDTHATGVVSGAGDLRPGSVLEGGTEGSHPVTVALAGQVYVKADASYGAISVGDLLTTSPTEGFAMRVADRPRAVGAIIGKALSPLASGNGLVRMLVVTS